MGIVQVKIVGLQPLERAIERLQHARWIVQFGTAQHPGLGVDTHVLAHPAVVQPSAEHGLALATFVPWHPRRIDIGGVDHPPAGFVKRIKDGEAGVLIGGPAEHVAAEH